MGGEAARLIRPPGRPLESRGDAGSREMAAARRSRLTDVASAKLVGEGGPQNAAYSPALFFL